MPVNNSIERVKHSVENFFGIKPKTKFKMLEENISVKLVDGSYQTWEQLLESIPSFVSATWGLKTEFSEEEKEEIVMKMFKNEHLPGAQETFRFTFLVDNMTYVEVSHFLRHREVTFSAVCTGDRNLAQDDILIPESIMNMPKLCKKYMETCQIQKELYQEAVDSKLVSHMDARYMLPKSTRQTYFMSMDWRTLVKIINQRMDRQIQPKGDNLIAYGMWNAILEAYPKLKELNIVNVDSMNKFYVANARKEMTTNLYYPEKQNDVFDFREDDFVYQGNREDFNGKAPKGTSSKFQKLLEKYREKFNGKTDS